MIFKRKSIIASARNARVLTVGENEGCETTRERERTLGTEGWVGEGEMMEGPERSFRTHADVRRGCLLDVKSDTL